MKVCDALSLFNTIECNSTCISVTPNEPQTLKLNLVGTHRKEHKKMKEKKKKKHNLHSSVSVHKLALGSLHDLALSE